MTRFRKMQKNLSFEIRSGQVQSEVFSSRLFLGDLQSSSDLLHSRFEKEKRRAKEKTMENLHVKVLNDFMTYL